MKKKIAKKALVCGVKKRKHDTAKGKADTNYKYCFKKKPVKKAKVVKKKKPAKRETTAPRRSARLAKKDKPKY
jgi:hypothetical protein